jgi:hypothetical protein
VSQELLSLGISIPLKGINDPRFENQLEEVMKYLVLKEQFSVTDLYSGKPVLAGDIPGLAKQISG